MGVANISGNILTDSGASLSSYLPLTGGTLTGALNGTSATFSSSVTANGDFNSNTSYNAPSAYKINSDSNWSFGAYNSGSTYLMQVQFSGDGTANRGFRIFNNNGNTELLRVTSTGNVGIGTSSPNSILDTRASASTTGSILNLSNTSSAAAGNIVPIRFYSGNTFGGLEQVAAIWGINPNAATNNGGVLVFATSDNGTSTTPTERMRITSGGQVFMGTTSAFQSNETLVVLNSGSTTIFTKQEGGSGAWVQKMWNNATSGDNKFCEFLTETALTARGSVTYNRGVGVTAYNTTSDYRLKTEIQDFDGLNIVNKLKPKEFRIDNAENKAIGFIAHELQEYLPQAVNGIKDDVDEDGKPIYQSVDYSQLTALLTKAIQELSDKVTALENK